MTDDPAQVQWHHPLCSAIHPSKCSDCGGKHCDCALIGRVVNGLAKSLTHALWDRLQHADPRLAAGAFAIADVALVVVTGDDDMDFEKALGEYGTGR